MHISQDRHANLLAHFFQYGESLLHARPAVTGMGTAVGLVEGAFIDKGNPQGGSHLAQLAGGIQRQLLAFHDAGARDEEQRLPCAGIKFTQPHFSAHDGWWRAGPRRRG